jgi:hypothetical protein
MSFRFDWSNGAALYIPCDRVALTGHAGWATQFPLQTWNDRRDITFFLRQVREDLISDDYLGT